jgi:hypothetical protein
MKEQKINHAAVWVSIVAFQALSILWFSPALFAEPWMAYLGKEFSDFNGESVSGLVFAMTGAIVFNYFLAWLFLQLKIESGSKGLLIALTLALSCFVFVTFTQDSFQLRPIGLSLINSGSIILNFCFAGFLLGGWKKYKASN